MKGLGWIRRLGRRRTWERIARRASTRLGRRGRFVFIACMPKSGSSFLQVALVELTGFRAVRLTYGLERREQELYPPAVRAAARIDTVTQQHMRANRPNLELMRDYGIRPVVLLRNLADVVVSVRDHLTQRGPERFAAMYASSSFRELDEKTQLDAVIDVALPWYIQFYASWVEAVAKGRTEALFLTYEEARADWGAALRRVADFYGLACRDEAIAGAVERAQAQRSATRFNRGVVGRGTTLLSAEQKQRIASFARYYPEIDFSSILPAA